MFGAKIVNVKISTEQADEVEAILSDEINTNSPDMGIKSIIDSQKKKLYQATKFF